MIRNLFIISLILVSNFCLSQSGWYFQNSYVASNLNSVHFINSQTGWCVGDSGRILKTSDGGINWSQFAIGTKKDLRSVTFTTNQIGYIIGDSGTVLKTTNGGNNWFNLNFNTNFFKLLSFINSNTGFIGGDFLNLYKTTDGGFNWLSIDLSLVGSMNALCFINETTGWGSFPGFSGLIRKTTNGGINWQLQYSTGRGDPIESIFFLDSINGWSGSPYSNFGTTPTIFKTTNGGTNWYDPYRYTSYPSLSIFFTDLNVGWATGYGGIIFHTSNSGNNWLSQTPENINITYRSLHFVDSLTGWCVGDSGRILKTTTGGLTFTGNSVTEIPNEYFLSQNYPNPFNPTTVINYELHATSFASLKIYDVLGNEVATLVNEKKSAGTYEVEFDGSHISSGIYFYRLEVDGNVIDTKRMVLLK